MNQSYLKKMKGFFIAIIAISVITPLVVLSFSYTTTGAANQIRILGEDLDNATEIYEKTLAYEGIYRKARGNVEAIEQKNIYNTEGLQNILAEKILEKSGININSFNIKNVPDSTKNRAVPSTPGTPWKVFGFAHVSLQGNLNLAKLPEFMTFVSTQEKLWHIEKLQINPMDNPADLISRFHKIEIELEGGNANEKTAILEAIEKRANKENIQITMSFFVPVISQRKENSK